MPEKSDSPLINRHVRLFLIEDDPGDVFFIKEMLSGLKIRNLLGIKFSLNHAARLESGIDELKRNDYDLLLLDLALPDGEEGTELIDAIRDNNIHVPIIVLTNREDDEFALEIVRRGVQDYLIKADVNSKTLFRSICYAIERHHLQEQLKAAESKIETLEELVPICAQCKKIRDDTGYWEHVERFVSAQLPLKFTHGYCPQCFEKIMNETRSLDTKVLKRDGTLKSSD